MVSIVDKKLNIVNDKVGYDQFYDLPKRNRKNEFVIEIFSNKGSFKLVIAIIIFTILMFIYAFNEHIFFPETFVNSHPVIYFVSMAIYATISVYPIIFVMRFDGVLIYTKGEVKSIDYHYDSDIIFLDKIRNNASRLGFVYEKQLSKFEELVPGMKTYEKYNVFSKTDLNNKNVFPEHKIAIYRSEWYHAETTKSSGGRNSHQVLAIADSNYEEHEAFVNMFCGKKEYEYKQTSLMNSINSIVIVIVDEMDSFLYNILFRHHRNYVLFCVIARNNPGKIFIGTDLRLNQDRDYRNRIKDLLYLLDIEGYDDQYLYKYFGPNELKHKGKRLYKRNR